MNNLILAVTDSEDMQGNKISALEIATGRLELGRWPIYPHTPNRKIINVGDQCLFYIAGAGPNAQHFTAFGTVAAIDQSRRASSALPLEFVGRPSQFVLLLKPIVRFANPISIKPLLPLLDLIKGVSNWGLMIQGGCRKLSNDDFQTILQSQID